MSNVDHPTHYGGKDNPYEAIKVIEGWHLNFNLGNTLKYIARAGHKGNRLEDLKKAAWYLNREIENEGLSVLEGQYNFVGYDFVNLDGGTREGWERQGLIPGAWAHIWKNA